MVKTTQKCFNETITIIKSKLPRFTAMVYNDMLLFPNIFFNFISAQSYKTLCLVYLADSFSVQTNQVDIMNSFAYFVRLYTQSATDRFVRAF